MAETPNRTCRDCGLHTEGMESLRELFAKHPQSKFGFNTLCLSCSRKRAISSYRKDPSKAVKRAKKHNKQREKRLAEIQAEGAGKVKPCRSCEKEKPANTENFYSSPGGRFGLMGSCKSCFSDKQKAYRYKNQDRVRQSRKRHYDKNRENLIAKAKEYYEANKEKASTRAKERYASIDKDSSEYAELLRRSREYAKHNPKKVLETQRDWRKRNPAKLKEYKHRRRALEAEAPGEFTAADIIRKVQEQEGCCLYCDAQGWSSLTVDHMTPLSRGGSNFPSNIAMACLSCNTSKGAMTAEEFIEYRKQKYGT